ncbi:hypothetical protein [Paraburkholderia hospita]|jgi:hypothetical protein|uniref:hypothetical protein n=2 Tax=Paraburkholderia TaxID=1822464 RepID=UPI000B345034|nr:hypothetical protein [Paraburkholderia hospita]OUL93074.1 hypothetical protein CA601_10910 [Paraburkholderia hospita]
MNPASRDSNNGRLHLHHYPVVPFSDEASMHRDVILQTSRDGRTVILVEFDERFSDQHATGPEQEVRHEIAVSELIQLIRAHGARL